MDREWCVGKESYIMFYSCGDKYQLDTGFLVDNKVRHLIIGFTPVSERISCLWFKSKFFNCSLINIHAPTEEKSEEEKDAFYTILERTYDSCPGHDVKIVLGDANAQIGKEEIYKHIIGSHSLHNQSNENGLRLIDFAESRGMIIGSTSFPLKEMHKGTWKHPDGQTVNQIDHVLIDRRHKSMLTDSRTFRGANVDSDHYLVIANIRTKLTNARNVHGMRSICKKYNTNQLKSLELATCFKKELEEELNKNQEDIVNGNNINEQWNIIKASILSKAEHILGKENKSNMKEWFDEECEKVTKEKMKHIY